MEPLNLAKVFADLATDPSWPTGGACWEHKLDKARLALMVVDAKAPEWAALDHTIRVLGINPSDYTKVKERVDIAEDKA